MGILFLFLFETGSVYPGLVLIFSVSAPRVSGLQGLCHHAQQSMFLQTQFWIQSYKIKGYRHFKL